MADLSDVEKAIAGIVSAALYPNGTSQTSAVGVACTVERGWPIAADGSVAGSLDNIMAAGNILVTVFPLEGMERNTTRFPTDVNTLNVPAPTITATVSGQTVTFGGAVTAAQNIGITLGDFQPAQKTYVYPASTSDTPTTIAAALAAVLVAAGIAATSTGPVLTLPATAIATAMVGVIGTTWQELKRQERAIGVFLWCPTPALRDLAAPIIDVALAQNEHLALADGSSARMAYHRTMVSDDRQTVGFYRRDFIYMVEYPTVVLGTATQIISTNDALTLTH